VRLSPSIRAALALAVLATALAACGKKPDFPDYPPGTPEGTAQKTYPAPDAGSKTTGWGFP
jgi:predicted small lipoprotein YifL